MVLGLPLTHSTDYSNREWIHEKWRWAPLNRLNSMHIWFVFAVDRNETRITCNAIVNLIIANPRSPTSREDGKERRWRKRGRENTSTNGFSLLMHACEIKKKEEKINEKKLPKTFFVVEQIKRRRCGRITARPLQMLHVFQFPNGLFAANGAVKCRIRY